jgi:hypothetical protein
MIRTYLKRIKIITPRKLKDALLYLYFKYHRALYYFSFGIPIFNKKVEKGRLVDFIDWVGPIESAAIVGKGSSILKSNPIKTIQNCEFKCLLNIIDLDYLRPYIGDTFDAQMTTHVGRANSIVPVLSKKQIKKYNIRILVCNSTKSYMAGEVLKDYWDYFNNRVPFISYMSDDQNLFFDGDAKKYDGHGLGITANLLRMLYEIKSLKKIVFAGIDAYHFGYAYSESSLKNKKVFYDMNATSSDPINTHGKPFIKFLFFTLHEINKERYLEVWFPKILKEYFQFPDEPYYKYYD